MRKALIGLAATAMGAFGSLMNGTLRLGNAIGTFDGSVLVNNIPADNGALAFTNVESMAQICRGIAC